MIKFYDPGGESHFGQATITRTTSVNGGLSLSGEIFAGDEVLTGLDYGWWLNFDNEKYVVTYKQLNDETNTIAFDAVQQFFWDFAKSALHAQYTGSHEYLFYLTQIFKDSGYTYTYDAEVPAFEKENWGYKNKLDLFNNIMSQANQEFEVHNEHVHIAPQIGSDLTSFVRKGINLSDLTEEMKISDFVTYARGYGAFKDEEDQSKGRLEVEYRSELAKTFGDLEMDPIVDERYKVADNLVAALKAKVDASYTVSMTMNIYDLENAGYPHYESPKVGDWLLAIDEALDFKRKIRIIKLEEQFDVTGKRIGYTATCGDLNIVDQYTNIQSSLDSKVQRIQESVDNVAISANGKNSNYYGAKEPVSANEGDLWFDQSNSDPDKWSIKQWANGRWEQITLNPGEVDAKVDVAKKEAETAVENAKSASDKADQLAAKYDDTNALANQALGQAVGAQSDASVAVKQASSAAADSKDAKQIAGAVSQSYKTLTDGSTMTIAELQNGLAAKLTKSDLNGYATQTWTQNQIKMTADGINGTMSSIKSTVDGQTTSINDLKADSSSFKSQFTTVNDTLGKQTTDIGTLQASSKSLSASFDSLSSDNQTNQHNISQLQASAETFNSTLMTVQQQVNDSAVGTNLLLKTGTPFSMTGNNTENQCNYGYSLANGYNVSSLASALGTLFTISFDWSVSGDSPSGAFSAQWNNTPWYKNKFQTTVSSSNTSGHVSANFNVSADSANIANAIGLRLDNFVGTITISNVKLEKGGTETDYSTNPADNVSWSEFQQTTSAINLKVSKDGVINAINVSTEGTAIYGKKLWITADTYIDNAVIKDAMIESINADKIQAGSIDADKIQVINLNANNITTGTINGSNLSINLNTGNVEFREGRIHNSSNTIDININSGYMSVANGSNRVMLKDGEMQFVEPGTYDTSSNPYLRISNTFGGQSTEGAAFIGRKYAVLANSDNLTGSGIFDMTTGTETFSGFATGYGSGFLNKGWHMTKIGGADRGVVISGGKATSYNRYWSASPSIMVGATHNSTYSGGMNGSNIIMDCNYLFNFSTWVKTNSHSANVYVADDGALVRASSASKYKTNIERSFETGMGERILEIPTAHWFDKAEVRKKTLDPQAPDPRRYFGMIADDLDDAGLTELVEYDEKGEVEGIMYDRVALTIIPIVRNYRDRITKLESEVKQLKEG